MIEIRFDPIVDFLELVLGCLAHCKPFVEQKHLLEILPVPIKCFADILKLGLLGIQGVSQVMDHLVKEHLVVLLCLPTLMCLSKLLFTRHS